MEAAIHARPETPVQEKHILKKLQGLPVLKELKGRLRSNVEYKGAGRYIPFAWSMNWVHDVMNNVLSTHGTEWIGITVLTIGGVLLTLLWFSHWEGRKNYE